jgi:hypothetical protein
MALELPDVQPAAYAAVRSLTHRQMRFYQSLYLFASVLSTVDMLASGNRLAL